ncbi:5-(carboxyamino)imidazole ribonucleotide synthase [Indiicoccus explosivorum]|uniref:5-(carboxyamino)imidazole ribonucleotide synthase n=1 Tax=Indiicoccus explosivorum TaxID=1917864 RepID=UPI000B450959|nr:5-(carboxyamino)imidazole ribonucleotide synthase [Indiicoccus explosivorum]
MTKIVLPGQTIGIIGGGQLGRMMALAARESGFRIAVLDPNPASPAGQVADIRIAAPYGDKKALSELAEVSDVITYEFENIDADGLETVCRNAYVPQGADLIRVTQNRILEKQRIQAAGVSVADYVTADSFGEFLEKAEHLGFPFIIKTATGGYDGKGQQLIASREDFESAKPLFEHGPCVAETFVPFTKEISVIIQRSTVGETALLPVAENVHKDHILHETIVPARISAETAAKAREAAIKIADHLNLAGTLAVEMFVLDNGEILVNELAPRPHNSGHFSIEACSSSQFHQHIRAICGWQLKTPALLSPAVMVNVLGEQAALIAEKGPRIPGWSIHLYGKGEAKPKRKMGHVTILTEHLETALDEIQQSGIWPE